MEPDWTPGRPLVQVGAAGYQEGGGKGWNDSGNPETRSILPRRPLDARAQLKTTCGERKQIENCV